LNYLGFRRSEFAAMLIALFVLFIILPRRTIGRYLETIPGPQCDGAAQYSGAQALGLSSCEHFNMPFNILLSRHS
jgi:hypothetical protein